MQISNPNDLKVVSFHNPTTFDFTPEMGCMYDGRAINGKNGAPGIQAGESMTLPYHVGHRLATNLAKRVLNTSQAATVDKAGIPTGEPIWSEARLQQLANTYITDLYSEEKPAAQSQTDLLMARVEEYKKMVEDLVGQAKSVEAKPVEPIAVVEKTEPKNYQDKQEVIEELEKRQIKFDRRQSKENLEKLLV